jgi:hypothetical protein
MYKPTAMKRPLLEKLAEAEPDIYMGLMLVACSTGAPCANIDTMLRCSDDSDEEFYMVYTQLDKRSDRTALTDFMKGQSQRRIDGVIKLKSDYKKYDFIAELAAAGVNVRDDTVKLEDKPANDRAKLMAAGVQGPSADKIRVREIAEFHKIHPFTFKLF